ncbi:proteasome subunit beta [Candidatus Woesearchaeota archaeon]|nr:MAG: proteasome subunit beta [Candidatus Woesearchaeota archaeon]
MNESEVMKTGTTTIALKCNGGIVLAADMRATAGNMVVNRKTEKIHQIDDFMAVTMAGTVSDAQLLVKLIKAELNLKKINLGTPNTVKEAANLLAGMIYHNIRKMSLIPGISHFILGGKDKEGFHIYDLFVDGSLTEIKEYVASGSGSVFAYGVLDSQYKKDASIDEGVKLAVRAINAALQRDSATGNGIRVVTITDEGVSTIMEQELEMKLKEN